MKRYFYIAIVVAVCGPAACWAINGSDLQLNSGAVSGTAAQLAGNGYAGTYINVAAQGDVTVTVNALGTASGGINPHMNIAIADTKTGFDVTPSAFNDYSYTFPNLPVGTYFVRTDFDNDAAATARALTIGSVSVSGATFLSPTNVTDLDNYARSAADTYIQNFRRGPAKVTLVGANPNTTGINVKLTRNAFNFGANVYGTATTNPAPLNIPEFTQFFKEHFNAVVPSRAGKWNNNESTRNTQTLTYLNSILQFAQDNNMRARMHNLIWGDDSTNEEQPSWVVSMLGNPTGIDALTGKTNLEALKQEINERIAYYVGDGPGGQTDYSSRYQEVDIYNESWHTGVNTPTSSANYWDRLGASGISDIYKQAALGAAPGVKLFTNEYDVLQNGPDDYANWYRGHIDTIQNADGDVTNGPVSGVGIQYYPVSGHSTNRMEQALQNLAVTGLPMALTEFGAQSTVTDPHEAAGMVSDTMRLMYGTPGATGFFIWGFWEGGTSSLQSGSILVHTNWKNPDGTWNLTEAGRDYEDLLGIHDWDGDSNDSWSFNKSLNLGAGNALDFTGYYGDYDINVNGHTYHLTLNKGDQSYVIVVAPGDYNGDGIVDAADYTVWRDTLGSSDAISGTPFDLRADGNGDGTIDQLDYNVWLSNFGTTYPSGSGGLAANVPEPASVVLLLVGGVMLLVRGRPRRGD